jgi:hypothetical protein
MFFIVRSMGQFKLSSRQRSGQSRRLRAAGFGPQRNTTAEIARVVQGARPMNQNVAPWFRREDYKRIRKIMDDGQRFPPTFEEWERTAKSRLASAAAAGISIEPVILDPDEFLAFCKRENHAGRGSRERGMFAISRAIEKALH